MKENWLKMYDQFGLILRIETVFNQPGEFQILRECTRAERTRYRAWCSMPKGVGNLHHDQSHALACNQRDLPALSHVAALPLVDRNLAQLAKPKRVHGRNSIGFKPARRGDLQLSAAVLDGDHIAQGFRNKDIRRALKPPEKTGPARRARTDSRTCTAISRLLKRLHMRGLIAKVSHTQRWRVTESGRKILSPTLSLCRRDWPKATATTTAV